MADGRTRRSRHGRSTVLAAVVAVSAAAIGVVGWQSAASPTTTAVASVASVASVDPPPSNPMNAPGGTPGVVPSTAPRSGHAGRLGEVDGIVPHGTSVFDTTIPAIANLDGALRSALTAAATDAAADGVQLQVDSGWRSRQYQAQLFRQAVAEYGSSEQAARWVATPDTSAHVSGDAVDVGPADAIAWLSAHGAAYGLCQIYANEPWHYELRPEAIVGGCPPTYADPTHDPRMRR